MENLSAKKELIQKVIGNIEIVIMSFQRKWTASCIDIRLLIISTSKTILAECKSLSVDVHSGFFLLFYFFVSHIIIILRHIFFRISFFGLFAIKLQAIHCFSLLLPTGISLGNTFTICYRLLFTFLVYVISAQCFSFQAASENAVKDICFLHLWFFEIRRSLRISLCLRFAFIKERYFPCSFIAIH